MSKDSCLYRIIFQNQRETYTVYAKNIYQSDLYGFIEIENYMFRKQTKVVIDPSEEKLKNEFDNVHRSYVPMHSIIRIDEVEQEGQAKAIKNEGGTKQTIMFPAPTVLPPRGGQT